MNLFLIFICAFPFLLWSLMGGNKQEVFGFSSDHFVTMYTFFSCSILGGYLFFKKNITLNKIHVLLFLLTVCYLSVIIGAYWPKATMPAITHGVYIIIAIFFIYIFRMNPVLLSYMLAACLFLVSLFLIIKLHQIGFGDWERLTFPVFSNGSWAYFPNGYGSSSDPNVLSFMLCAGSVYIFFTLPNKRLVNVIFPLSMACSFLTFSRSSFLSFIAALLVVNLYSFFKTKKIQVRLVVLFIISLVLSFFLMKTVQALAAYNIHKNEYLPNAAELNVTAPNAAELNVTAPNAAELNVTAPNAAELNVTAPNVTDPNLAVRIYSHENIGDRIARLKAALIELTNLKTLFIGKGLGYSASTQDPHNFYLSTAVDSGVFILAILITFLTRPLFVFLKLSTNDNLKIGCIFLTTYYLSISLFYWQVRVLYFFIVLLFTLLNLNRSASNEVK